MAVRSGPFVTVGVELAIESLAGGFPGSIDAMRTYLQSPAMVKRVPEEVREEFLASEPFTVPEGEMTGTVVKTGFRLTPEGKPWIGSWQVKATLQQAAKANYTTSSKPSIYQMARAITYNLEILPHELLLIDPSPMHEIEIDQIISHPRMPNIKIPSIRKRQIIDTASVRFNALILNAGGGVELVKEIETLFRSAGPFIGLGTDRGYGHGRFQVTQFEWGEHADDLVKQVPDNPRRKGVTYERGSRKTAASDTDTSKSADS